MALYIFSYQIAPRQLQRITMPLDAEILSVGVRNGHPYIYALADPHRRQEDRLIYSFATTDEISYPVPISKLIFIGTYSIEGATTEFHIFENPQN